MPFVFRTPIRVDGDRVPSRPNPRTDFDDGPGGNGGLLMRHVQRNNGKPVCVYIDGGVVGEKPVPTQLDMAGWDVTFLGGRDNVVTAAQKTLLEAAGYVVLTI